MWREAKRPIVKHSTMCAYNLTLQTHLLPRFGNMTSIGEADVQRFALEKLKSGLAKKTVRDMVAILKSVVRYGNKYAAYTLGKAYLDGDVLAQNIDEAVRLLNLSASKNFAPAQFIFGRLLYKGEVVPKDIKKSVEWLDRAAAQKNPYAAYLAGKIYLTEDAVKDIQKDIRSFIIAAENGNDFAEYQLGKIYLYGKGIPRNTDTAMYYLHLAAEHGNQYAAQLIHSIRVNGNWTAALVSLRLLGHIARIIKNRIEDKRKGGGTDRKLLKKIEEKKQAQGLKQ